MHGGTVFRSTGLFTKAIDYTDFPLAEITLHFVNNTILLPSEY